MNTEVYRAAKAANNTERIRRNQAAYRARKAQKENAFHNDVMAGYQSVADELTKEFKALRGSQVNITFAEHIITFTRNHDCTDALHAAVDELENAMSECSKSK